MTLKKIFAIIHLLTVVSSLRSQETEPDTSWKTSGIISLNFSQAYYENWVAGGTPSYSGVGFFKWSFTYQKMKWRWNNVLDLAFGQLAERSALPRKTDDKINYDSKLGYSLGKNWHLALLVAFRTQFTEGYQDPELQEVKSSDFMAPAYLTTSLGPDYNYGDKFSLFVAPISIKTTVVLDEDLAGAGAYGVNGKNIESASGSTSPEKPNYLGGKYVRYEIGANLKMITKTQLVKNVEFQSKLELYMNYIEKFGNIDVNWEGLLNMKVNDFLSANLRGELIYDDEVDVPTGRDSDGNQLFGPRVQIKQLFGIGIGYKF